MNDSPTHFSPLLRLALLALVGCGFTFFAAPVYAQSGSMAIATNPVDVGTPVQFALQIDGGEAPQTDVTLAGTLPVGLAISSPTNASADCVADLSVDAGAGTFSFTVDRLGIGATCVSTFDIEATAPGNSVISSTLTVGGTAGAPVNDVAVEALDAEFPAVTTNLSADEAALHEPVLVTHTYQKVTSDFEFNIGWTADLPDTVRYVSEAGFTSDCPNLVFTQSGGNVLRWQIGGVLSEPIVCVVSYYVAATAPGQQTIVTVTQSNGGGAMIPPASNTFDVTEAMGALQLGVTVVRPGQPGEIVPLNVTIRNRTRDAIFNEVAFDLDLAAAIPGMAAVGLPLDDACGVGSSVSGTSMVTLTGGQLAAEADCSFQVMVQIPEDAVAGLYPLSTSVVSAVADGAPISGPAVSSAVLVVGASRLVASIGFDSAAVATGSTVQMTLTVATNDDSAASDVQLIAPLAGFMPIEVLSFAGDCTGDVSIANLTVAGFDPEPVLHFENVQVPAGSTCTFTADVLIPHVSPGNYPWILPPMTGTVDSEPAESAALGTELRVVAAPTLRIGVAGEVTPGATITLGFDLSLGEGAASDVTDIEFTLPLDAVIPGVLALDLPLLDICGVGSMLTGAGQIAFSAGSVVPSGTCEFEVEVALPADLVPQPEPYVFTTTEVAAVAEGLALIGDPASFQLTYSSVALTKEALPSVVLPGGQSVIRYELTNRSDEDLTVVLWTESFDVPGGMVTLPASACGGTTSMSGATAFQVQGASVLAGTSCTFEVQVVTSTDATATTYDFPTVTLIGTLAGGAVISPQTQPARLTVIAEPIAVALELPTEAATPGSTFDATLTLFNAGPEPLSAGTVDLMLDAAAPGLRILGRDLSACGADATGAGDGTYTLADLAVDAFSQCDMTLSLQMPQSLPIVDEITLSTSAPSGEFDGVSLAGLPAIASMPILHAFVGLAIPDVVVAGDPAILMVTFGGFGDQEIPLGTFGLHFDETLPEIDVAELPIEACGGFVDGEGGELTVTDVGFGAGSVCAFDVPFSVPADTAPGVYSVDAIRVLSGRTAIALDADTEFTVVEPPPIPDADGDIGDVGMDVTDSGDAETDVAEDATGDADEDTQPDGSDAGVDANIDSGGDVQSDTASGDTSADVGLDAGADVEITDGVDDSGCGCSVPATGSRAGLVAMLGCLFALRRRRRA